MITHPTTLDPLIEREVLLGVVDAFSKALVLLPSGLKDRFEIGYFALQDLLDRPFEGISNLPDEESDLLLQGLDAFRQTVNMLPASARDLFSGAYRRVLGLPAMHDRSCFYGPIPGI